MNPAIARPDPPYLRIVDEIRRRIISGQLRAGDRVPSTRQITEEWGVAIATATKVLGTLRQEGLVRPVPGVGTVVAAPATNAGSPPRAPRVRRVGEAEPELTRDRVVRTAIDIADAEGLAALSMRRVAAELGLATMSLYRYVSGKEELVRLMADVVFGEDAVPEPGPADGWRANLEALARLQWAVHRRHPWTARVVSLTRPQLIPNGMAHTDWAMRAVDGLGLDLPAILHVAVTLGGYVHGIAVNLESEVEAQRETGVTSDEWLESQEAMLALIASGRFPMLARLAEHPDFEFDLDTVFEFGLTAILDGLATLIGDPPAART